MSTVKGHSQINLPLLAVILIPAFAVIASLVTVAIAVLEGDRELPEQYHWEGFKLDRDFERFERARQLNVRGTLEVGPAGSCRVHLTLNGPLPSALDLSLVHATLPHLDQRMRLIRKGDVYEQACEPRAAGSWRIEIGDPGGEWSVRQHVVGALDGVTIEARASELTPLFEGVQP